MEPGGLEPPACQILCYPTVIRWIDGGVILQEIMALSRCSNNDSAPNAIFLACYVKNIGRHLGALIRSALNDDSDFSAVTDGARQTANSKTGLHFLVSLAKGRDVGGHPSRR